MAAQEISRLWESELEEVGPGGRGVHGVPAEDGNILAMVHGAAIFALMDEAFQAAVHCHGTVAVALNMSLTFMPRPRWGASPPRPRGPRGRAPPPISSK